MASQVLWVRLYSFANHSTPQAFGSVLAFFLIGIAAGAWVGKRHAEKDQGARNAGAWLMVSGVLEPIAVLAFLMQPSDAVAFLAVAAVSATRGAVFPIVHHMGTPRNPKGIGQSVSKVYFANIVGSALGPLLAVFVLLDHLTLTQSFLVTSASCIALGLILTGARGMKMTTPIVVAVLAVQLALVFYGDPHLAVKALGNSSEGSTVGARPLEINRVVENRHGIVHTVRDEKYGDIVYGNNIYDGRLSTNPLLDSNGISRIYFMMALHPAPKRILTIGLAGGAWVEVMRSYPSVEHIDVVEINPGYLAIIQDSGVTRGLLSDKRISLHFDEGRRWLRRNGAQKYDMIIMNTSLHWRIYATNVLSAEFQAEAHSHLSPGGIFTYNATGRIEPIRASAREFSSVYHMRRFVVASDQNIGNLIEGIDGRIRDILEDRGYALPDLRELGGSGSWITGENFRSVEVLLSLAPGPEVTDDNMYTEFHPETFGR